MSVVEEGVLISCGAWGAAVIDRVDQADPAVARRTRRLHVGLSDAESTGASAQRIGLLLPSHEAFQHQLHAGDARRMRMLAPSAWLADVRGAMLGGRELDERYRHRLALLAAEQRVRRRLAETLKGCRQVLVVGAPDEPLASASLLFLASWTHAANENAPAPSISLLLGLDPLGSDAEREPQRAARLHAFLAELDRVRDGGEGPAGKGDPFDEAFVMGRPGLSRELLILAAGEAVAWWIRGGEGLRESLGTSRTRTRTRGRPSSVRAVVAATASISLDEVAQAQASHVAAAVSRQLLAARDEPTRDLANYAEKLATDIRSVAGVPTPDELDSARQESGATVDPALAARARVDRGLQRIAEREAETRAAGRAALFGGAIQRMERTVSAGYVDQQVAWAWQLMLAGRAALDDVVSTLSAASLGFGTPRVAKSCEEMERLAHDAGERAERRRREGAPSTAVAQANAQLLRAAAMRSRCDVAVSLLTEAAEALGRASNALASVRATVTAFARLAARSTPGIASPWHAAVPLDPRGLQSSVFGQDGGAAAWLATLAATAPGDPSRGLARPPDALCDHLRGWCAQRLDAALAQNPIGELKGLDAWLASFLAGIPATSALALDALGSGEPSVESFLLATAGATPRLAAALPRTSHVLTSADPARIGWLSFTGPLPLFLIDGVDATRSALETESASGRLLPMAWEHDVDPSRFREPAPGDLAWRARQAMERAGLAANVPPDLSRRLDSRTWSDIRPALLALRKLPRELPALRQVAVLGEWASLARLEDLATLERGAQEIDGLHETDASDAELLDVVRAAAASSMPVKKTLESGPATQALVYLTQAHDALSTAQAMTESRLMGLERVVLRALVSGWREMIAARIAALRGRSDLAVHLLTRRLVAAPHATLLVEVENRGEHPALAARVELLDAPHFRVLGPRARDIGEMPPGARQVVEIALKPARAGMLPVELALSWDDLEASGKTARTSESVELITELPPFRRIERNPYIAGPPVRSEAMFFGRQDIFRFIAESLAGRHQDNILILHGQRRTGKSSILCQLERRDLLPDHLPVLVDVQGMGGVDTAGLLYQLARHATRRLARLIDPAPPLPDRPAFEAAPYDAFQEHFDDIEDALARAGKKLLFMIDEFDALEDRVERGHVEPEVFPFLRNLMQHRERVGFLLAGTQQLVDMRHDYWSILFSLASYRQVSCLPADAARDLIQRPLEGEVIFDDLVVESMLRLTAGHPYYLQLACQSLVQRLNHSATHACVTSEDLQAVLPEVLAAGGGHFEHEWRTLPTDAGRAALAVMADRDDTGMMWFGTSDLGMLLAGTRSGSPVALEEQLPAALGQLVAREILEESAGRGAWRIRIDLLRHWIRRQHPPERLAVATSGGGA